MKGRSKVGRGEAVKSWGLYENVKWYVVGTLRHTAAIEYFTLNDCLTEQSVCQMYPFH